MKRRKGFVSNSSTCSFIVAAKEFPDTTDLAEFMILDMYEDLTAKAKDAIKYAERSSNNCNHPEDSIENNKKWLQEIEDNYKKLTKNLAKLVADLKDHKLTDSNLAFRSIQFDTFIRAIEVEGQKYYYVSTCNNICWDLPHVIPHGRSSPQADGFNDGDLYDGAWNEEYLKGRMFMVIDTLNGVTIKDYCKGIDQ